MSAYALLKKAIAMPPGVVASRLIRELRLAARTRIGWKAIEQRALRYGKRFSVAGASCAVIAPDALNRAVARADDCPSLRARLVADADLIATRRFEIFGVAVPPDGAWPWRRDWRFGKEWPQGNLRSFDFYEQRDRPFDVKFPWELSRLSIIVRLVQSAALFGRLDHADLALALLQDWKADNPPGRSINWVPMETSMRAVNLVMAIEIASRLPAGPVRDRLLALLAEMLIVHGEIIWRVQEYTHNRGNHYTANIVSLLLLGALLRRKYPPAHKWYRSAQKQIAAEIILQFTPDGVNFEKAVGYHRLVTELFMLSAIALDRAGTPLPEEPLSILHRACSYAQSCQRPDGWSINVGDSDDATALAFDELNPRDHSALIELGAAFFHDRSMAGHTPTIAAAWLAGLAVADHGRQSPEAGLEYYDSSGVVVFRRRDCSIWIDVGEVGQNGHGGHGHNDLFSFEWSCDGQAIIVDPGTYLYTGDLEARKWFRSTAAHNGLSVDGEEIAPLLGTWRISDVANPFDVNLISRPDGFVLSASHSGYHRLADPVTHKREFSIGANGEAISIADQFVCRDRHHATRYLHFAPGVNAQIVDGGLTAEAFGKRYIVRWNSESTASLDEGWVSERYAHRTRAPVLILTDTIDGQSALTIEILKSGQPQ